MKHIFVLGIASFSETSFQTQTSGLLHYVRDSELLN